MTRLPARALSSRTVLVLATGALVALTSGATAVVVWTGTDAVVRPPTALAPLPATTGALPRGSTVVQLPPAPRSAVAPSRPAVRPSGPPAAGPRLALTPPSSPLRLATGGLAPVLPGAPAASPVFAVQSAGATDSVRPVAASLPLAPVLVGPVAPDLLDPLDAPLRAASVPTAPTSTELEPARTSDNRAEPKNDRANKAKPSTAKANKAKAGKATSTRARAHERKLEGEKAMPATSKGGPAKADHGKAAEGKGSKSDR